MLTKDDIDWAYEYDAYGFPDERQEEPQEEEDDFEPNIGWGVWEKP